ncbi:hypothetical protein [Streptomyces hokutonensis]|uniref:hypothetical protein n=1 Tax=Streptomyces hokutonensis TaxID=1306990 RepID=UPI00380FEE69
MLIKFWDFIAAHKAQFITLVVTAVVAWLAWDLYFREKVKDWDLEAKLQDEQRQRLAQQRQQEARDHEYLRQIMERAKKAINDIRNFPKQ